MTAFFGGVIFGMIFAGSICVAFVTRARDAEDWNPAAWEDPFEDVRIPPPLPGITTSINRRNYTL